MRELGKEELADIERIYRESVKEKMNASFYLNLENNMTVIVTPNIRKESSMCELRG